MVTEMLEMPLRPTTDGNGSARRRGRAGQTRPLEEIERARRSAALTRQVVADPSIIRDVALQALKDSQGRGPAMADALARRIEEKHGVTFAKPAVRAMLKRLEELG